MSNERRESKRIDTTLPLKLSGIDSDLLTETSNISANGAYCAVTKPVSLMTKLKIVILVPTNKTKKIVKKISCEGVVVRSNSKVIDGDTIHYLGIYFNDLSDKDRKTLVSYINSTKTNN